MAIGARENLDLTEAEAAELAPSIANLLGALQELHEIPGIERPESPYAERDPGRHPSRAEDPFNAFVRICDVRGASSGILSGKTIGLKDNIDVAGVPTTNASATAAFVPSHGAVVVERILAAGGRIVGTLNMDNFGAGASGESSAFGPPLNPHDTTRSPGGSSGGSGAAVAAGAVDLALGVDQAGSARIPASFCGVVAIKATHGLVPTQALPFNTAPLNLSGHPVLALPSGRDRNGLPTSVQLVGAWFDEAVTIRAGRVVEAALA
jgi:amidase